MRFLRILLFSLFLIPSAVFAQSQEKPQAYKFFEYGKISNKLLKEKLEEFRTEVLKLKNGKGLIVNFGKPIEIKKSVKQIADNKHRYYYDGDSWLSFIDGGIRKKIKTEFWIIPEGAEEPILTPEKK